MAEQEKKGRKRGRKSKQSEGANETEEWDQPESGNR
jgi:hypothetical protein